MTALLRADNNAERYPVDALSALAELGRVGYLGAPTLGGPQANACSEVRYVRLLRLWST